nr:MAG TPA: hypothetical protein [Caudoviricetes sp.]
MMCRKSKEELFRVLYVNRRFLAWPIIKKT